MSASVFTRAELIASYSRAQALEDGVLIDAMQGDFAEVSQQHYRDPLAMTASVFALLEQAVNNPRWLNDYKGIWADILWMSRCTGQHLDEHTKLFQVIIQGAGRKHTHTFKIVCGPGDEGERVLTVMLPDED